jgi:hypothetical protein
MDGKGVRWRVFLSRLEEGGQLRRGNFNPRLHNLVCAAAFWIDLPPATCRAWAVECVRASTGMVDWWSVGGREMLFLKEILILIMSETLLYGHQSPHVVYRYHRTSKEHAFRATHPYTRVSERVMREVKGKKRGGPTA